MKPNEETDEKRIKSLNLQRIPKRDLPHAADAADFFADAAETSKPLELRHATVKTCGTEAPIQRGGAAGMAVSGHGQRLRHSD